MLSYLNKGVLVIDQVNGSRRAEGGVHRKVNNWEDVVGDFIVCLKLSTVIKRSIVVSKVGVLKEDRAFKVF